MSTSARVGYTDLFKQDRSHPHWAYHYAQRLVERHGPGRRVVIQTSMSPSGWFHVGNFRDTACAYLVHRALRRLGQDSLILLSFDDYDPIRVSQAVEQPDLAGYGLRPLGAATERSTRICRRYVAELKRMGICPADADADGRTPADSPWQTHYQHERYLAGTYVPLQRRYLAGAGKLAKLLGQAPEHLFSVYCEQCGRGATRNLRLGRDRVRYACASCGALTTTRRIELVKPSWALDWTLRVTHERIDCEPAGQDHCSAGSTMDRTRVIYREYLRAHQPVIVPYGLVRQFGDRGKVSGSRGGGMTLGDLMRVMPPRLILFLYGRPNCLSDFRLSLEFAAFLSYYDAYDRFLAKVRAGDRRAVALHDLITDENDETVRLPGMRAVLGLLQTHCYDVERVTAVLGQAAAERVRHAHAWLAAHGRCWIDQVAEAEPGDLLVGGDLPERWTRESYRTLYLTLFGTEAGPPLRRLEEVFDRAELVAAVHAYRDRGDRPLRDRVLAQLRPGESDAR
ncbi:hypothetical protein [Streptosporangium carneum]|uniref:Lysine--tRNA ligase n=1 Tax=Streptosporangium carneum TaxID=47481 RepID=A0A9W6MA67_9ACTN|nr:hypothetical protein [Streptosporangium carneum]GLK06984.1 hypothetical protein GCM10017600_03890 [Streptosporangium carneum]